MPNAQEKIAALRLKKDENTQKAMKIMLSLQRLEQDAQEQVGPLMIKLAKSKEMRKELEKLEDITQQQKDVLDRELKSEIAAQQKVVDDQTAHFKNLANIEQEDLKAVNDRVKEAEASIELWTRLEAMLGEKAVKVEILEAPPTALPAA